MWLFGPERVAPPLIISLFWISFNIRQFRDRGFDWQIRDKVKVHLAR